MYEQKHTLREQARKHRASLYVRAQDFDAAAQHFFDTIKPTAGQVIAAYWPIGHEFDPQILAEQALEMGCICALPVVQNDSLILKFAKWTPNMEMSKGAYDVPEPQDKEFVDPDIVLLPLLAFDRRGYRLGQGGGYYDATLAFVRARNKKALAVGLAFAEQAVLFNLPVEPHDEKLDWIITPQGAQSFKQD